MPASCTRIQERRGAAVHDRHFVVRELDDDVVDADADEGGEQMLDGLDRRAVFAEHRRVVDGRDVLDRRGNLDANVGPPEDDAGIGRRRLERQRDFVAGVQVRSRRRKSGGEVSVARPFSIVDPVLRMLRPGAVYAQQTQMPG